MRGLLVFGTVIFGLSAGASAVAATSDGARVLPPEQFTCNMPMPSGLSFGQQIVWLSRQALCNARERKPAPKSADPGEPAPSNNTAIEPPTESKPPPPLRKPTGIVAVPEPPNALVQPPPPPAPRPDPMPSYLARLGSGILYALLLGVLVAVTWKLWRRPRISTSVTIEFGRSVFAPHSAGDQASAPIEIGYRLEHGSFSIRDGRTPEQHG